MKTWYSRHTEGEAAQYRLAQGQQLSAAELAAQESVAEFFRQMDSTVLPNYYRTITASLVTATNNLSSQITSTMRSQNLPVHEAESRTAALSIMARASVELARANGRDITNTMKTSPGVKNWMNTWQNQIYSRAVEAAEQTGTRTVTTAPGTMSTPSGGVPGSPASNMAPAGSSGSASGSMSGSSYEPA